VISCALRHPLVIALVQLGVGLFVAYFLTERWQRWRQRRDFQYRTMVKFSETSMDVFVSLSDLLASRPAQNIIVEAWAEKQKQYIAKRVLFHALEPEIMASFTPGEILAGYHVVNTHAEKLFEVAQSPGTVSGGHYEPVQDAFLKQRKELLGRMIVEMKLLSWWERRTLRRRRS
jgi:hypothetical protein